MSWMDELGPESNIVLSSRVRIARNLENYPFPFLISNEQAEKVKKEVYDAIIGSNTILSREFMFIDIKKLNNIDREALVEKHLASPLLIENFQKSALLVKDDETISIMVNEEDHLRIQCILPGFQLEKAWDLASKIDDLLEERLNYAYDEKLGYLTCCPTNLGTGIRASVMLHLPALVMNGQMNSIIEAVSKVGLTVRGLYGEGSEASGNIFQVSNQVTLGQSEEEIINNLKVVAKQIIEKERAARAFYTKSKSIQLEDRIMRSYGLLTNCRILSSEECMKLLSDVRLGVDLGILKDMSILKLNEVMIYMRPANLQKIVGKELQPFERDIKRAEFVRTKLKKV